MKKKFIVTWHFASGFEMTRSMIVEAKDHVAAKRKVERDHEQNGLRIKIEIISVRRVL